MGHPFLPFAEHPVIAGLPSVVHPAIVQAAYSDIPGEASLRVLVVDDDMRIADTTAEVLQLAGFDAKPVYTADAALQLARSFRPDCLLSDVVMSGMNGVELAVQFRSHYPATRIVLMTGQAGVSDILDEAARQDLEFEVLSKPIQPRKLIEELRKTGNGR